MDIKRYLIMAVAVCCGSMALAFGQTRVVAHRGFWKTAGSAQNSRQSLIMADSVGAYASEFDVWRTHDGVLFCNHDKKFKGVSIEEANAKVVRNIDLDNGENIPSLYSMLSVAKGLPRLRLVLELKEHTDKVAEEKAVEECIKMVKEMGLADRTDYITFSKEALENFVKYAPEGSDIYYLTGDLTPEEVHKAGANGIDYHISEFRKNPDWVGRAHSLGMKVNVWTVDIPDDMRWCVEQGINLITTNNPVEALEIVKSKTPGYND